MIPKSNYICCFGEVLWDLLPSGRVIGGAPFNVAAHLNNLGVTTYYISRIGNDELGNEIRQWLKEKKFSDQWIQTDEAHRTGIVNVSLHDIHQATYEIVEPVAWDFISHTDEMTELVMNSRAIVFGTLACRNSVTHSTLLRLIDSAPLKIFDVNLRAPHYSKKLIESLLHHSDVVKMNDDELRLIASWNGLTDQSEKQKMIYLKENFSLQTIIVTKGGEGALLMNDKSFSQVKGFRVTVADTVGSGDSFLAGFLKNFLEGKPMQEALTYASALGALVASHHGANPPVSEKEIFEIMKTQQS